MSAAKRGAPTSRAREATGFPDGLWRICSPGYGMGFLARRFERARAGPVEAGTGLVDMVVEDLLGG